MNSGDSIVDSVVKNFLDRSAVGQAKYAQIFRPQTGFSIPPSAKVKYT